MEMVGRGHGGEWMTHQLPQRRRLFVQHWLQLYLQIKYGDAQEVPRCFRPVTVLGVRKSLYCMAPALPFYELNGHCDDRPSTRTLHGLLLDWAQS